MGIARILYCTSIKAALLPVEEDRRCVCIIHYTSSLETPCRKPQIPRPDADTATTLEGLPTTRQTIVLEIGTSAGVERLKAGLQTMERLKYHHQRGAASLLERLLAL